MKSKLLYWIPTALLCGLMLLSASMYIMKYDYISSYFPQLGFPAYLVYPLAIVKILAVIALLSNKSKFLSEWAYAGIFFDVVLAASAHLNEGDGQQ
jgi:hypothetical protein